RVAGGVRLCDRPERVGRLDDVLDGVTRPARRVSEDRPGGDGRERQGKNSYEHVFVSLERTRVRVKRRSRCPGGRGTAATAGLSDAGEHVFGRTRGLRFPGPPIRQTADPESTRDWTEGNSPPGSIE